MEDRPDEEDVVDVRAVAVRVVGDDHVARLEALGPVLLDRVAHRLGHRAGEEQDAGAHRRRRLAALGRAGDRRGEVVEVAQDRAERGRQQAAAHVLDDVAEADREHRRGEAVAAVARCELGVVGEVAEHASCALDRRARRWRRRSRPGRGARRSSRGPRG